jgi:two-component system alkaline phosphatase synthesis response regulator PhoP
MALAPRILVVDDDRNIVRLVRSYLEQAGMSVVTAYDGDEAMHAINRERPALVVLDLMMPKRDGWQITEWMRGDERLTNTPILMLTARADDSDKIMGLELGADDYLTKPFNPMEVVARVRAILRRSEGKMMKQQAYEVGGLRLDVDQHMVTVEGKAVDVTPSEFTLLHTFLEHPNRIFTRAELIERGFGYSYEGLERTLDTHIKNLRRKIGDDPRQPRYIETVFGVGYRLCDSSKRDS